MKRSCGTTPYAIVAALFGSLLLVGLAGCATAPASYGPKSSDGVTGYTDEQLAQNRYRVTYSGTRTTPRETVEDYLLFRAAQVTQQAGFAAFLFDTRDTKAHTTYFTDSEGWFGFPGRRRFGYWSNWPLDDDFETWPVTRYEAYAEIVMLNADQAKAEPRALFAQDVLNRLGPKVIPPATPGALNP